MSDPAKAVFLSYAREDADAARRIAEALRSAGLEVWFDENELRGGDSWDTKLRGQIGSCALFLPIISAQTQARAEGYFRREWKLADHRTEDMGRRRAFLVPVCIDDTKDAEADVPDSFLKVQWTRLPGALPTPEFVAQVKRLLEQPVSAGGSGFRPTSPGSGVPPAQKKSAPIAVLVIAAIAMAISLGLIFLVVMRKPAPPPVVSAATAATEPKPALVMLPALKADKSIAVLPFANMSEEKDASAFFADGIHEDILTNLALIRQLRVVSRTSVAAYRSTTKPMKQIAQELGVTYILEGSVRRVGNKVRVTGQLIHAATDEHVWAQAYDRDLTDIFAIQGELAQAIARELKAALTPGEVARVEQRSTDNLEAYDLFLRARSIYNRMGALSNLEGMQESIKLLQRAVELDPGFYRAWAHLATVQSEMFGDFYDESEARVRQAWAAVEQAVRLAPESREAHVARGHFYYARRDYARADEENEWIIQHYPQDAEALRSRGFIQRRRGRWTEALATLRRALELDPGNITTAQNVALHLWEMRRYDEARAAYQRLRELRPEELESGRLPADLATLDFLARGSTVEGEAFFAALSPTELAAPAMAARRKIWSLWKGDHATFARLEAQYPDANFAIAAALLQSVQRADPAALRAKLQPFMTQLRADLQREPGNAFKLLQLAQAEAVDGDHAAALRAVDQALAAVPVGKDAFYGGINRYFAGSVYAWTGDKERALAELAECLRTPPAVSTHYVRTALEWWPLHGDPRYEALLNDPKNNQPLF